MALSTPSATFAWSDTCAAGPRQHGYRIRSGMS
jgi:hypothetical protein